MNNKVKFNICNCHYALQRVAEDGEMAFDTPVAMPGAVSLVLDPNGEPESFYADGIEYYIIANNMGYLRRRMRGGIRVCICRSRRRRRAAVEMIRKVRVKEAERV